MRGHLSRWVLGCFLLIQAGYYLVRASNDEPKCHHFQDELLKEFGSEAKQYYWFPKCLPGGFWENVQCNNDRCYCAYVDTGLPIPNTMPHYKLSFMRDHCPILSKDIPDPCGVFQSNYPCKTKSKRYYYSEATDSCIANSKSCLGFETMQSCSDTCVVKTTDRCNFQKHGGHECTKRNSGGRWYHDDTRNKCRPFFYKGCGGNSNNYKEKWACLKTCEPEQTEELIIEVENKKYIIRLPTWLVVQKLYVPSANNKLSMSAFKNIEDYMTEITEIEAEEREGPEPTKKPDIEWPEDADKNMSRAEICALSKEPGPCRAFFTRWYFKGSESKCEKFAYGGCLGNGNKFLTAKHCAQFCDAKIPPSEADMLVDKFGILFAPDKSEGEDPDTGERSLGIAPPKPKEENKNPEIVKQSEAEVELLLERK